MRGRRQGPIALEIEANHVADNLCAKPPCVQIGRAVAAHQIAFAGLQAANCRVYAVLRDKDAVLVRQGSAPRHVRSDQVADDDVLLAPDDDAVQGILTEQVALTSRCGPGQPIASNLVEVTLQLDSVLREMNDLQAHDLVVGREDVQPRA